MRKRIFLAVSTSDLATRNRIFFPPCRIRSTALKPGEEDAGAELAWWGCTTGPAAGQVRRAGLLGVPGLGAHPVTPP